MSDHDDTLGLDGVQTEPMPGGIAFDLVTRQALFVIEEVAGDLHEYYDAEGFDLLAYKMHPYLPVRESDSVYSCVYVNEVTAQGLTDWETASTYDFPRGRLAHVPIEQAWTGDGDE